MLPEQLQIKKILHTSSFIAMLPAVPFFPLKALKKQPRDHYAVVTDRADFGRWISKEPEAAM